MSPGRSRLGNKVLLDWIRLIRSENVGPITFRHLVSRFGDPSAALQALPDLAMRGGARRPIVPYPSDAAEAELRVAERMGAWFLDLDDPLYPQTLRAADAAPPLLAVMGEPAITARTPVAIVGSRKSSAAGARLAETFAASLGASGCTIVSGLARGIDTSAHRASLDTGTVGVFAGGLDKPYPDENRPLMRAVVDHGGCLVTEMPFGWEPRAVDFPRRNRIVVGLSLAVLVVEAAKRSGSLISARLAGEMGRLVFAVPGSPLEPRAAGTNALLKDGASFALEPQDLLDELAPLMRTPLRMAEPEPAASPVFDAPQSDRDRIVQALGVAPAAPDDILAHAEVDTATLQLVLIELELAGRLERHPGGNVSLSR
ncbi:DNA-processing protein DprA [Aureimonas jatrophae]|uniref:DNA processing protein n=1 Tax=Aureimonas jatrophae TaxID=1166073 RepID=A0A1H0MCL4_9HYPH|nr:DNA-processing protein DprA [Aureimonas jatrophae]MBB3951126.1 DNA processing protein [Aureimonas jatrophae]SDO78046.1 DNA processing protein [Aureimonas jatrophae]